MVWSLLLLAKGQEAREEGDTIIQVRGGGGGETHCDSDNGRRGNEHDERKEVNAMALGRGERR